MARIDFKLPDVGEGIAEGEITSWKVNPGDAVTEDQIMVEVMTDKATVEIGSPVDGKIVELLANEGDTVPVGNVIVVLESEGGGGASDDAAPATAASESEAEPASEPEPEPEPELTSASSASGAAASTPEPARATSSGGGEGGGSGDYEEIDFPLPDVGEGIAEGEVTKWLVDDGDEVTEDQPIVEVMTDKATVEIGSPVNGVVVRKLVEEGQTVPVGEILVVLGAHDAPPIARHGEAPAQPAEAKAEAKADPKPEPKAEPKAEPAAATKAKAAPASKASSAATERQPARTAASTSTNGSSLPDTGLPARADGTRRVRAAPATRRLARELGVDVATLAGSGRNGRVTNADVMAAAGAAPAEPAAAPQPAKAAPAAKPAPAEAAPKPAAAASRPAASAAPVSAPRPHDLPGDERVPLRGLRKRIAAQMRVAKQTAAHFTYVEEIDVTKLVQLRKAAKAKAESKGVKITFMPFIMKAVVPALREFPLLNASLDEEALELVMHKEINLGIAVDTPNGLIVPVVKGVESKSMFTLAAEMNELAERARDGKSRPDDLSGGTFTITNAGNIGGLLATPVINVPEVAILGVHAIRRKPWVVDDEIVIRDIMYLSLSLDHRVVDGAVGARAMNVIKSLLEDPSLMLLEAF